MMLWLLAILSVVTTLWGIAHRLMAVQSSGQLHAPAALVSLRQPHLTREPLFPPTPKNDPPTPRTGRTVPRTQNSDTTCIKENNA